MKLRLLLILTIGGIVLPAIAYSKAEISLAPSLLIFNYAEYGDDGSVLDREKGVIPGLELKLDVDFAQDYTGFVEYTLHDGVVSYDGHTQSYQIHKTKTDETLTSLKLGLAKSVIFNGVAFKLTIFQDSMLWDRSIRSNNGVGGLTEVYEWKRVGFGINRHHAMPDYSDITVGFELYRIKSPEITVYLNDLGYGQPKLDLTEKNGIKLHLGWKKTLNGSTEISTNVFYEYYEFGKSATMVIDGAQGGSIPIHEPRSESSHVGAQVKISREF